MTSISDITQIILSQSGPVLFAGCAALVACVWQFLRIAGLVWSLILKVLIPVKVWSLAVVLGGAFLLSIFAAPLHNLLQEFETRALRPVYLPQYTQQDSAALIRIYENRIRKFVTPEQLDTVRMWTAYTAERIGSTPQAIYEAAWLECGLNPFRVRDDKVAAGWIQFTRAGLKGLGVSMNEVIRACERREIAFIMSLTDRYLARKAERLPQGATMRNTIDLYLAIFAPAYMGSEGKRVVYAGFQNPAYYKNSGLDGWTQTADGRIVRSAGDIDGKITIHEIWLCLERKKALLLKN